MARNVLGGELATCSESPRTGFYRNGCCDTGPGDLGVHTVCARVTAEFLAFSASVGNDLSTPHPELEFPGLQPGDQLYLTKPIGTGVITTAHKRDLIAGNELQSVIEWMAQLNDQPSFIMSELGCRAATDVTGYGLLGHAMEMARASEVCLELEANAVPLLAQARQLRAQGAFPGGSAANRSWLEKSGQLHFADGVEEDMRDLLCDAQTSGGLLLGLPVGNCFEERMRAVGRQAWRIGSVRAGGAGIRVVAGS